MMRALNEMGAMRIRISADGSVDVSFAAPSPTQDKREEDEEREALRKKREEEDDLFRSAG